MIFAWRMPGVQILLISKCSEGNRPTFQKTMKLLPSRLKIKEHGEKEKWRASPILYLGNFVTRSGLGVIEYLSHVGAKAVIEVEA